MIRGLNGSGNDNNAAQLGSQNHQKNRYLTMSSSSLETKKGNKGTETSGNRAENQ